MGMGSGFASGGGGGAPIGGKGGLTTPVSQLPQQPGANAGPPRSAAQYSQPYQQQYMPPPQQQFSMAAPPRQYVQQPYNLSGAMNTANLGQQQQMSRPPTSPVYYPNTQTYQPQTRQPQQSQQPPRGLILSGFDQPQQQQQQFQQQQEHQKHY